MIGLPQTHDGPVCGSVGIGRVWGPLHEAAGRRSYDKRWDTVRA
jgi:hypothetical protein